MIIIHSSHCTAKHSRSEVENSQASEEAVTQPLFLTSQLALRWFRTVNQEAKMLHEGTNLLGRRNKIITITDITSLTLKYNEMLHRELIISTEIQVQIVSDYFF